MPQLAATGWGISRTVREFDMAKYNRDCAFCGKNFTAQRKHRVTCSRECAGGLQGEICFICKGGMKPSTTGAKPGTRAHGRCWKSIGVERACEYRHCKAVFVATDNRQTFCTQRCAQYEWQFRAGPDCVICSEKIQLQDGLDPDAPKHLECMRSLWVDGACMECGIEMNTDRAKKCQECIADGRTCSVSGCDNILRARGLCIYHYADAFSPPLNHLRFSITDKTKREILKRDKGICRICDIPVDFDVHHQDRWAPSIDHIVPVSHMLFADNTSKNLRLTHYGCNASRGNRTDRDHIVAERSRELYAQR